MCACPYRRDDVAMSHSSGAANGTSSEAETLRPQCPPLPLAPLTTPPSLPLALPSPYPPLSPASPGAVMAIRCGIAPATAACSCLALLPRHRLNKARIAAPSEGHKDDARHITSQFERRDHRYISWCMPLRPSVHYVVDDVASISTLYGG